MNNSSLNYSDSGCSRETKAASGFFFFMNEVLGNFTGFIHRTQDGKVGVKGRSNVNHRAKEQGHQETNKQMPLEQLIKTGFYPFS